MKTGDVFGRLTVIALLGQNSNGQKKLKCQCSCGNIGNFLMYKLKNGSTKSCGCLSRELVSERNKLKIKNEIGKVYGRLTVVEQVKSNRFRQMIFECVCHCGTKTSATGNQLRNGSVNSCGNCGLHAEVMGVMSELGMVGRGNKQ